MIVLSTIMLKNVKSDNRLKSDYDKMKSRRKEINGTKIKVYGIISITVAIVGFFVMLYNTSDLF